MTSDDTRGANLEMCIHVSRGISGGIILYYYHVLLHSSSCDGCLGMLCSWLNCCRGGGGGGGTVVYRGSLL